MRLRSNHTEEPEKDSHTTRKYHLDRSRRVPSGRRLGLPVFVALVLVVLVFGGAIFQPSIPDALPGHSQTKADQRAVAVIGGAGFAGSFVMLKLAESGLFNSVVGFDMNFRLDDYEQVRLLSTATTKHSQDLNTHELSQFGVVLFLGGCTGKKKCAALTELERHKVQVTDVINLAQKMNGNQLLLVSSTGAVLQGHRNANESRTVDESALDEFSLSLFHREQALRAASSSKLPRIHVLRFGTLVGISPAQRTDLLVPTLFKSAYTTGVLQIQGALDHHSFLGLSDFARAIRTLIESSNRNTTTAISDDKTLARFQTWNLASFHATTLKMATTVASLTEAVVDVQDVYLNGTQPFVGFTLDCQLFEKTFNFHFQETIESTLSSFDSHIPESVIARGPHSAKDAAARKTAPEGSSREQHKTIPCPVCGATDPQVVFDLKQQSPLVTNITYGMSNALTSPHLPLRLVRCRVCNHFHLSQPHADGEQADNLFQASVSKSLQQHFEWLAKKITDETNQQAGGGNVLELGCNHGFQLDQFQKLGWNTFCVEQAQKAASVARTKNHTVNNGAWPVRQFPNLPVRHQLHAIVAQNDLLASSPVPIEFLKACVNVMGPKTKLYIQTSQCNMQLLGQFDAMHQGHISFFTGHSFVKAAELAGLYITSFETTQGESCLVTMELGEPHKDEPISLSVATRLELETREGMTTELFGEKFSARAHAVRDWMATEVSRFFRRNYTVGAHGATAKGMALLRFILDKAEKGASEPHTGENMIAWVLNDDPLTQKSVSSGTTIPILPTDSLANSIDNSGPLVIVVLAWDALEESVQNIQRQANGRWSSVVVLTPFPTPQMLLLRLEGKDQGMTLLREMTFNPTPIHNPIRNGDRKKALLIMHQKNEEFLLPYFILQHAPLFDNAILIDYNSTDRTRDIIELYAPTTWTVVDSRNQYFSPKSCDSEVVDIENQHPDKWALALTVGEHLIHPLLRSKLYEFQKQGQHHRHEPGKKGDRQFQQIYQFPMKMVMSGDNKGPLMYFTSLLKQRHIFGTKFLIGEPNYKNGRFMHYGTLGSYKYTPGRHLYKKIRRDTPDAPHEKASKGFIAKFVYTPHPENVDRLAAVAKALSPDDIKNGVSIKHHLRRGDLETLLAERSKALRTIKAFDLCDDQGGYFAFRQAFRASPSDCP